MKKEIVFDSSTAILLAKIQLLSAITERLKAIFPESVKEETTRKKGIFDSKLIAKLINEGKIQVLKSHDLNVKKLIKDFNIEKGEAEALELSIENKFPIATDDGPSIKASKILGIEFITAIHFLVYFYENGLLDRKIAMEKLKMLEKFGRYGSEIIKDARNRMDAGEK